MLMVQTNAQPMKTAKIKGPPPVPPRPNQSVVAEALAKTRKAVADSKANLTRRAKPDANTAKAKTLERANSGNTSVSPKQNGLARVKSFIRDVISDRSSSSDERRSSGQNSRRSSSDSCSIPAPIKRSNESLNSKAVKTCKQILVRSLSTSNKLDQDSKCKVTKSLSFAEKTLPLRKAPPPPLSPKPKLKPMKPLPLQRNSHSNRSSPKHSPEISPYSSPIDAKPPKSPVVEAPYATVEEVQDFDDRLRNSPSKQINTSQTKLNEACKSPKRDESVNKNNNSLERKTSRVTEMLISEIIASRNNGKKDANTVIDKGKDSKNLTNGSVSPEMEIMKDMNNHEMLIYELQTMRSQSNVPDALETKDIVEVEKNGLCDSEDSEQNYAMSSVTSGNTDDGYDQAYAYILDDDLKSRLRKQFRAISTMSLQGLPPLPKSLSGFADGEPEDQEPPTSPADPPPADLDSQLTYLKKEMASLRQLDLSLLSELWSLSEAMAAWGGGGGGGGGGGAPPPPPPPPPPPAAALPAHLIARRDHHLPLEHDEDLNTRPMNQKRDVPSDT